LEDGDTEQPTLVRDGVGEQTVVRLLVMARLAMAAISGAQAVGMVSSGNSTTRSVGDGSGPKAVM